jgi:hypothetical protein
MMARYYSFPTLEQMLHADIKIGESEIALELMGFNAAMVAGNIATSNEEDVAVFERISKEVQGPGFFVIIAGDSPGDFAYKKKVLETIVREAGGESLKSVEDPETEGILLCQCTRISASIRESVRTGGYIKGIQNMGQRDLTVKWAIGASKAKVAMIEKGLIADDGGDFFGWGVEHGHLGKTELFCKFSPLHPEAFKAVNAWQVEQKARAIDEKYFAVTLAPEEEVERRVGPALSNYHVWWYKVLDMLDPNGVIPQKGISYIHRQA